MQSGYKCTALIFLTRIIMCYIGLYFFHLKPDNQSTLTISIVGIVLVLWLWSRSRLAGVSWTSTISCLVARTGWLWWVSWILVSISALVAFMPYSRIIGWWRGGRNSRTHFFQLGALYFVQSDFEKSQPLTPRQI